MLGETSGLKFWYNLRMTPEENIKQLAQQGWSGTLVFLVNAKLYLDPEEQRILEESARILEEFALKGTRLRRFVELRRNPAYSESQALDEINNQLDNYYERLIDQGELINQVGAILSRTGRE